MYLFIDTETTGLPDSFDAPSSDTVNWPRLVTASWIVCGEDRRVLRECDFIIRPEGFAIPSEATKIHGISQTLARHNGQSIETVLGILLLDLSLVTHVVAHNINFDRSVIESEFHRYGALRMPFSIPQHGNALRTHCTQAMGTNFCKLPGKYGSSYKWPKLTELHSKIFGKPFEGSHTSMADVRACMRCFFALVDRNEKEWLTFNSSC